MKDFGVIYLAFGKPYLIMALNSMASLRQTNPEVPVCIVTNERIDTSLFSLWDNTLDHLIFVDKGTELNRTYKTSIYKYSPFEKTIFLDCDTLVIGDVSVASQHLDFYDYAIRLNSHMEGRFIKDDVLLTDKSVFITQLPHWNSGVILFKKGDATRSFFDLWAYHYTKMGIAFDQASLVETVFRSPARMLSLDYRWNFHPIGSLRGGYHRKDTLVLHYTSRISDVLYTNLLQVCEQLGYDKKIIHDFVKSKRLDRKKKVGMKSYFFLWLKWKLKRGRFY